ncbi:helix-turn-helix domain-containing protein [Lapidilactobacillus gannanensis]|uniref:Helix-turn-helix domain-containing protein n=1 Tax=Lapidilactobacillus gannanensis TaxID=2486002 RepID=A0ABW4BJQ2_9LACO|nr:helix-turn-helix domain-containing protein [Lapidilactobacillus gannanensis]
MGFMNIERFVLTRKKMGFSQQELAAGICTQATLSRLENNGQIPTMKILIQLCRRLQLTLDELFPKVGVPESQLNQKMDRAEFNFVISEYQAAQKIVDSINEQDAANDEQHWRFLYLRGYLATLLDKPITDALFDFNQILMAAEHAPLIYKLLAHTGCGMAYARHQQIDKADFYFSKVLDQIYQCPTQSTKDVWRVLSIVYNCGDFYGAYKKNYLISDELLHYAISICSDNHVTYYLAKIQYQLALNAIAQAKEPAIVLAHIEDSRAFSRINGNHIMLTQLAELQKKLYPETVLNPETLF